MGLPDCEKIETVSTHLDMNVTDGRTDIARRHKPRYSVARQKPISLRKSGSGRRIREKQSAASEA